ncbi:MAG TPA: hypothetical protein VFV78_02595 [Vicinamibacterales bacterium]|nr:hypothetical protein [Vicinamibacterales bacterium]
MSQVQGCNVPLVFGDQLTTQRAALQLGGGIAVKIVKHVAARAFNVRDSPNPEPTNSEP